MALDELIAKVQKLRRLATNAAATEHEAAAAAAAADRLIQEHGLQEAQLQADSGEVGERPDEDRDAFARWDGSVPQWQLSLAVQLIRHYNCACYRTPGKRGRWGTSLHVIGRPSDVSTARYMYSWLVLEIERLAKRFSGQGKAWINSYKHGASRGVLDAMYHAKKTAREEARAAAPQSAALAIFDRRQSEAEERLKELHEKLRSGGHFGGASDFGAFARGKVDGANIHTGSRMGGGSGGQLKS